jgi:hypothetical protein
MIVEPFYSCGNAIGVEGARFGATVTLRRNGAFVASAVSRGTRVEFPLSVLGGLLSMGGSWDAIQSVGGFNSPPSLPATARNVSADYPSGLPVPVVNPSVLYVGARGVGVQHVAGATLQIRRTRLGANNDRTWLGSSYPFAYAQADAIFTGQDSVSVRQTCGGSTSSFSTPIMVQTAPPSLSPAPTVVDNKIFAGQSVVDITGITFGARVEAGPFVATSWPTYAIFADIGGALGRPLIAGESISLKESLGVPSLTSTVTVRPCSQLPAARADAPRAGTRIVSFNDIVSGSILRVIAGGVEIADGSGTAIRTTRALVAGEVLTITQELPGCSATQFFRIGVQ